MLKKTGQILLICSIMVFILMFSACGRDVVESDSPEESTNTETVTPEPEKEQNEITALEKEQEDIIQNEIKAAPTPDPSLVVRKEEVIVPGLEKEHHILFFADSHISMCDERDSDVLKKAEAREASFSAGGIPPQERFDSLMRYAKAADFEMVILGGDILDSAMYASVEHVENQLKGLNTPYLMLMGNHDFEYGKEYFSEEAFKTYLPRLANIREDLPYQIRETEDLIYFSLDDGNNRIDPLALEAFKKELGKGKPIVVATHVPIEPVTGDMLLVEECIKIWGASDAGKSRVTLGVNGCYPDNVTKEFINLVTAKDSPVVLVLAGHIHFYHRDMLNEDTLQLVTGAACEGEALEITLK